MADCGITDFQCATGAFAASAIGDAITKFADAVMEGVGRAVASLGTVWVNIGTPTLTGGDGGSVGVTPGEHAPDVGGINTVLGWATWIAFGICVLSLIAAGARMGLGHRDGSGQQHVDRLGVTLLATIIISAAVGLVTAIAPAASSPGSPTVAFIQNSLWWYIIAVAVIGVIVGAIRMAWAQRAEAGKDLVKSLLTLVVVSGTGLTAVSLLVAAGDSFSVWLLDGSLGCSVEGDGTCFGSNMAALLALTSNPATGGLGAVLLIVLGLLAIFGSVVQIFLMVVRAGMLVVLAGVLPVSAAATNTDTGRTMFRKTVGWLIGFILYKPAAAIVYATAFQLTGTNVFTDDGSGLISVIVGLTLMTIALVALPALMALIVPAVSAVASGSGMATTALAGASTLPSGAVSAGRLLGSNSGGGNGGGSGNDSNGGSGAPSGSTNSAGPSGGPGAPGLSGSSGASGSSGGVGAVGGSGPAGAGGSAGAAGTGAGAGAGTAGTGGGAGAGAGAAGAGAGASAGAAAGPVGAVVGAAVGVGAQVVTGAVTAGTSAVQSAARDSSGEPDGSR